MSEETKPKAKTDPMDTAMRALQKLPAEVRIRVIRAAVALWGIEL